VAKMCVMEDRSCINCGQCLYCDMDSTKICDNCCECLGNADYAGVEIDDILINVKSPKQKGFRYPK